MKPLLPIDHAFRAWRALPLPVSLTQVEAWVRGYGARHPAPRRRWRLPPPWLRD